MIRLQPLPDELDRSYLGALMRFNGWREESEALNKMATWSGEGGLTRRQNPSLQVLSRVAGMSLVEFVREHSTLAVRRSIASRNIDMEHGCPSRLDMVHVSGPRLARPGAYLCKDCAWEDVALHGRSYWRRSHQATGQYWCSKHFGPLSVVEDARAFFDAPSNLVERAKEFSRAWTDMLQRDPLVQRFCEISERLAERAKPLPACVARDVLRAAGRRSGIQLHEPKSASVPVQPLLSDAMLKEYPDGWIQQVVPAVDGKDEHRYVHSVDGVLWSATLVASPAVYVVAIALLFDSANEVSAALNHAEKAVSQVTPRKRQQPLPLEIKALYQDAGGSHHCIRRDRPEDWYPITKALNESGLPNLPKDADSPLRKAMHAFLVEGKPIADCLAMSKEARQELESLIRAACVPLTAALIRMEAECRPPPPRWRRHKASSSSLDAFDAFVKSHDESVKPKSREVDSSSAKSKQSRDRRKTAREPAAV